VEVFCSWPIGSQVQIHGILVADRGMESIERAPIVVMFVVLTRAVVALLSVKKVFAAPKLHTGGELALGSIVMLSA